MFFPEFAQTLHRFIFCRKGKAAFTHMIFTNSFPHYVCASPASLKRYYDGKVKIDSHIIDYFNKYSTDRFAAFLEGNVGNDENVAALVKAFSSAIPDLFAANYSQKIAELLGRIYQQAANRYFSSRCTSSEKVESHEVSTDKEPDPALDARLKKRYHNPHPFVFEEGVVKSEGSWAIELVDEDRKSDGTSD